VNDGKEDGKISPDAVSFRVFQVWWWMVALLMRLIDRRELLAFAHAASVELYPRAGPQAVCGEVLIG
jgi:hypothetical protein